MSIKIVGMKEIEAELEKRFGRNRMQQVSDEALLKGAQVFVDAIIREISSRPDKGYADGHTVEDITVSEPMTLNGIRTVKIHWKTNRGTYRLIHLNEFGTVKNSNPPRKGAIAKALRAAESEYKETIKSAIEGAM